MKRIFLALSVIALFSCKNNTNTASNATSDSSKVSQNISSDAKLDSIGITKIGEHLRTLQPVDTSVLLSIFPESLLHLKRTEIRGSEETIPLNEFNATYEDGAKTVNIHIIDGGSTNNDAYMTTEYYLNEIHLSKLDNKNYEIEKIENINNIKTYQNQLTTDGETNSTIDLVINNRFGISISGKNITLDELKTVVNSLNLTKLK